MSAVVAPQIPDAAPNARASGDDTRGSAGFLDRAPRAALAVFVAVEILGLALFLWFGRQQWFWWDEWELLAGRRATSIDDILRPYHGHPIGTPVLVYRGLWSVFGLHSYLPYQLLGIATHLGVAALLRIVMRRAGVAPWIATAAACVFVLFGTGKQNIMWGFQIAFTGALFFGLVQMLLADHKGRVNWRDGVGLLAGVVALACSGAGVAMVFAVGVATLLRRGIWAAALQVVPLAALFAGWWLGYGRHDETALVTGGTSAMRRFVFGASEATLHSLGQLQGMSWLLVAVLVVGLVLAWRRFDQAEVRRRAAQPLSLALAVFVFLGLTAWGRALAIQFLSQGALFVHGRYRYVAAALLLPALAVAANELACRWRIATYLVVPVLLVGVPYNVKEIADRDQYERREFGEPAQFGAVLGSPLLEQVPADTRPFPEGPIGENVVTVEWMRAARDAGKLPDDLSYDRADELNAMLRLALLQSQTRGARTCRPMSQPEQRHLEQGSSVRFRGTRVQVMQADATVPRSGRVFDLTRGNTITAIGEDLDLKFTPVGGTEICD